jgi:hypothetical protein
MKTQRALSPLRWQDRCLGRRYLAGAALLAGGLLGAEPVVVPGLVLGRGVTSRMPEGAAGAAGCAVFCAVEDVPAWLIEVLFRP